MSLRARLAIGLAVLAAAAATAAMGIAYAATAGRLDSQVDQSLEQAGARLASMPAAMGPSAGPGGSVVPPFMGGTGPAGVLGLVVIQYLGPAGEVTARQGQVALPVQARDRALARSGGSPWLHSVTVGGVTYRALTEPVEGGGAVQVARDDSENQAVLGSLRWRFGLLDAAVAVLAAVVGLLFAGRLTGPLRRLASAAEQVASTGRLDIAVDSRAKDETGRLAAAFSAMLGALRRSRARQHLLAEDAAHELRTPLTSLRANVDILRRHQALPDQTRTRILGALDTELRELTGLVDELVELGTDRHGEQPAGPVALDHLAQGVVERARQRTGRTITLRAEPCVVEGRSGSIARALSNLIDNAVKFSADTDPIEVSVADGRVEVRDHGPGIAAEDLPRVFDRFYRSAGARSKAGSGLGLAIVSDVAEAHGGHAFAASHPGGGAVVGFELPTASAARSASRPRSALPGGPGAQAHKRRRPGHGREQRG